MTPKDLAAPSTNTPLREARKVCVSTMLKPDEDRRLRQIAQSRKVTRSTVVREAVLSLMEHAERRERERRAAERRATERRKAS